MAGYYGVTGLRFHCCFGNVPAQGVIYESMQRYSSDMALINRLPASCIKNMHVDWREKLCWI